MLSPRPRAPCRSGCRDDMFSPWRASRAARRRRARVLAAVRRSPASGLRVGDIANERAACAMRHRHCTQPAPAARSRAPSCRSGRTAPSSRRVAQRLRLPYHSHVPVGARANVAQTWGYAQASSTSTLCLRLVVGAARVAVSGEALGGGFLPGWGAARVTRAPRVESRRPADADACPVHGALSRPHSTASRLAC